MSKIREALEYGQKTALPISHIADLYITAMQEFEELDRISEGWHVLACHGRDKIAELEAEITNRIATSAMETAILENCVEELEAENAALKVDAESWVWIPEFVDSYQVSTKGRVRSVARIDSDGNRRRQKYLHPTATQKGYLKVSLWKAGKGVEQYVHRLVASAFCSSNVNCDQVNHIDGDPANNEASNLEWVTASENITHSTRVLKHLVKAVVGTSMTDSSVLAFDSMEEAAEAGFTRANILSVIKGDRKHHKGYTWAFAAIAAQQGEV